MLHALERSPAAIPVKQSTGWMAICCKVTGAPCTEPKASDARRVPVAAGGAVAAGAGTRLILSWIHLEGKPLAVQPMSLWPNMFTNIVADDLSNYHFF